MQLDTIGQFISNLLLVCDCGTLSIPQCARIHSFQSLGAWLAAEDTQKTTSLVRIQYPVAGLRLKTVRFKRSTVLISGS